MSDLERGRVEFTDPTQRSFRESPSRPIGLHVPSPPLLRTPDGIPDGWCVSVGKDGIPVLERMRQRQDRFEAALREIVRREARSEYTSIYAAPGEFASVAREALKGA